MPDNNYYVILFYTIHDVLKAEKILKQQDITHELIPVPRNLSSDCGMCVRLQDNIEKVLPLLNTIEMAGCYDEKGKQIN